VHYEVRSQEAHAPEHEEIHCREEEPATRTKRRISLEALAETSADMALAYKYPK
jgi:hypothetical protein